MSTVLRAAASQRRAAAQSSAPKALAAPTADCGGADLWGQYLPGAYGDFLMVFLTVDQFGRWLMGVEFFGPW
uniref:SFRICE_009126 n=1 Tax=Spodoptera frugiperda TaxID=7108 RepID=A0A2H1VFG4_SPOFR